MLGHPVDTSHSVQEIRMYIAIEGVIGVGKTSLAKLLAPEFDAQLVLEIFEENPFLSSFYGDRKRYAFQTQVFFLLSRYHQQGQSIPAALKTGNLITDYTFDKDAIFARLNLTGDELATYNQVHEALAERLHRPDLILYLRVETEIAMRRIANRDRTYERDMDRAYIEALNQAYQAYFGERDDDSVLTIESTHLDFVSRPEDLQTIIERVRARLAIPPYQPTLPMPEESR
jgi:deoxyguanosine kinase